MGFKSFSLQYLCTCIILNIVIILGYYFKVKLFLHLQRIEIKCIFQINFVRFFCYLLI